MTKRWQDQPYPAHLEERLDDGVVRCHLSPRNCRIRPGQHGFCMVRANRDGRLVSLNFGRSVHATEETIETEGIFHVEPGARILSMGPIGCMLNCDYCHNWKTSQARHADDKDVHHYTPQELVDIAVRHGIRVLSWTYNDPAVWHEFVIETAKLAKQKGIVSVFKSALFMTGEAIEQLLPVVDYFAISLKSMDPAYYRRLTKGWLEPVLEGVEQIYRAGKHLEVSTLMVTDVSDNETTARALADFVGERLGPEVPTHFERFHPDYKMTATTRTPVERLERARRVALDTGLHHVYVGNVYDTDSTSTWCRHCGVLQVTRYGMNGDMIGLTDSGACVGCGADANIKRLAQTGHREQVPDLPSDTTFDVANFDWHGDVQASHVQVSNGSDAATTLYQRRYGDPAVGRQWSAIRLQAGESYRFIAAKSTPEELGFQVAVPPQCTSSLHEVFDRAHFPTQDVTAGVARGDVTPLPLFETARTRR
ncbi:AmmeMemoRadiSam system radical SAM enzyme [Streptomyces sp. TR06-5]|uniref:AmmeMemoRadiSam system radical SAM enzyme n=1 Tax=unclassified Streptomyces TaxID=2593676 RepID=UPI0039A37B95